MEIQYLKRLSNYPIVKFNNSEFLEKLEPLQLAEIVALESTYNEGNTFPIALRELLYLAGAGCYLLDFALYDSQAEMQEEQRRYLLRSSRAISRPFFAIDAHCTGDQFSFVYLDEGNDPIVRHAILIDYIEDWNRSFEKKLSEFIDYRLSQFLKGYNVFGTWES